MHGQPASPARHNYRFTIGEQERAEHQPARPELVPSGSVRHGDWAVPASALVAAEQAYAEPLALGGALSVPGSVAVLGSWRHRSRDQVHRLRNRHRIELGPRQLGVSRA